MDRFNLLQVIMGTTVVLLGLDKVYSLPLLRNENVEQESGAENNSDTGIPYRSSELGLLLKKHVKENEDRQGNLHGHIVAVNEAFVEALKKSEMQRQESKSKTGKRFKIMEHIVSLNERNGSYELPFEGDIELTPQEKDQLTGNKTDGLRMRRNVITSKYKGGGLWPNGVVYYAVASNLAFLEPKINAALKKFQDQTCLVFRRVSAGSYSGDYVLFTRGHGCKSRVGRVGGKQEISLGKGCEYTGVIMHEIMHAVGIWHEQSRPDRDKHVLILWDNIQPQHTKDFSINDATELDTLQLPYDFISIMHYDKYLFSKKPAKGKTRLPTILRRDHPWRRLGSQREGEFTSGDIAEIRTLYKCNN